ncbi:MAG: lipopolysaccharide heptosyltransferase II [Candidatus Omnitrophica bacterium]|nr:lipopolysaccharide heptosyltransferase II [Candidatus Omnitrophota bacterium]
MSKKAPKNKRILIFNVNWLGDVLFSTSALKALRQAFPKAYIASILHPRTIEVLQDNPNLDEIIIFDEKEKNKHLLSKFSFVSALAKKNFDTVYLFHRSFTRSMLMALAKIPHRIGYKAKKRAGLFLTQKIALPKGQIHRVDYFLNILRESGIDCKFSDYEFFVDNASREKIARMFEEEKVNKSDFFVCLNPGGNWNLKRWQKERFAQLADRLTLEFKAKIIITGSAKDLSLAKDIASQIREEPIITCGSTSLKELGAIIERSKLFISADSGPMHIAAALGVPIIALFGPTSAHITGPRGKGKIKIIQKDVGCCIPCYKVTCKDNRCMKTISVEDCIAAVREIIS